MTKLFFSLTAIIALAQTAFAAPKAYKAVSDNDLVDAKNLKLNLDILDNLHILKRDEEEAEVKRGTTFYSDNDLIDLKNLGLNLDILKRGSDVLESIIAREAEPAIEARGRCKKVTFKSDNDLLDLKNLKAALDILRRDISDSSDLVSKRGSSYYSDNDLIDLKGLGININLLSGKPRYCVPVKPQPKPTHKPKPQPKPTHKPHPKPTHKPQPKPTSKHHPKPSSTKCDNPKPTKHHQSGGSNDVTVVNDNDLLDLKNLGLNLDIL